MNNETNLLYVIKMRHPCLGTVFELPSHGAQSQFQFLFKKELLQGFHLCRGSSNMNIIKIGDIKIFAGTPSPASTLLGWVANILVSLSFSHVVHTAVAHVIVP